MHTSGIVSPGGNILAGANLNMTIHVDNNIRQGKDCDPYCLFNIVEDLEEWHDLSSLQPDVLKELVMHYEQYAKEPQDFQDQGYHTVESLPRQ